MEEKANTTLNFIKVAKEWAWVATTLIMIGTYIATTAVNHYKSGQANKAVLDTFNYIINFASVIDNTKWTKTGGTKLRCFPIGFLDATSFTLTGSTDTDKLASVIAVLKANGLAV